MRSYLSGIAIGLLAAFSLAQGQEASPGATPPTRAAEVHDVARVAEPLIKPALIPLAPGAVEPSGWLLDWAVAAKEGITGHLDERHWVFGDAWKGVPFKAKSFGTNPDGTGWPLEQCAYWLDGALRLGLILHDDALVKKVRARLDPLVDEINKAEFGTTFIYWKKNWKPSGFNSWAHSHMGRALVALYEGTGEKRVLDALTKVYADYSMNSDKEWPDNYDVTGLCNLDAMMETYSFSGDPRVLERATAAINMPEARKRVTEWAEGKVTPGHMVTSYENIRIPAVMYPWTGRAELLQASNGVFRWLDERHMMPYGLASGEECVAGVGAGRKTETCDIPAMLVSANWMYRIEGDGAWGDRMEKAFFNAGPAPVSRDFKTASYYQAPNRIKLGVMPQESFAPGKGGTSFGPLAFPHVLCCIAASNRILPLYLGNMWMATADKGLAAALYGPCTVNAFVGPRVPVKITSATDYPFNESIRMTIEPEKEVEFPLYLRLPGWCNAPQIAVNGNVAAAEPAADKKGFVKLTRTWRKGDVVTLVAPMSVHVVRGHEGPYPEEVRSYFGHTLPDFFKDESKTFFHPRALPFASVNYGPLLFALPIPEKDDNTAAEGARYQYALDLHPAEAAGIKVIRRPMPAHWDWSYDAPLSLEAPVQPFDWKPTALEALPAAPVEGRGREMVKLVPYGCTKFHVSMFPVTAHAWQDEPTGVAGKNAVDLAHLPPRWNTAIYLPDDRTQTTRVDKSGELLYGYRQGGREFATRIGVRVTGDAVWQNQERHSLMVPIVKTHRAAPGLSIVEEVVAILPQTETPARLHRLDYPEEPNMHTGGSMRFEVASKSPSLRIAMSLCDGWYDKPGMRVQVLRVEGAPPKTVDTIADIGRYRAAAFWFDAKDVNGDGKIEISVDAAEQSSLKNTLLNGLWVFPADAPEDSQALLAGKLNASALAVMNPPGLPRHDMILVHVTNTGKEARTLQPKLIVDTTLGLRGDNQRLLVNNCEVVTSSLRIVGEPQGMEVSLELLTVPAGQTATFFVLHGDGRSKVNYPATLAEAIAARDQAGSP